VLIETFYYSSVPSFQISTRCERPKPSGRKQHAVVLRKPD